ATAVSARCATPARRWSPAAGSPPPVCSSSVATDSATPVTVQCPVATGHWTRSDRHRAPLCGMHPISDMAGLLQDKVAIVTGAGQGIGRGIARMFALDEGAKVAVVDLDGEAAGVVAKEIAEGGGQAIAVSCD